MKFLLALVVLFSAASSLGQCVSNASQTCTPNLNLYLPFHGSYQDDWEIPYNNNSSLIDQALGGTGTAPLKLKPVVNLDDIIFLSGTTTCDAAVAALGSNPGTIIIPSTYTGPECAGLTFNAIDGSAYTIWRGSTLITIQDLRASTNKAYGINYGGITLGSLAKLAVTQSVTSPTTTVSAILGTTQVTGNLGLSGGSYAGATFEIDVEGALTGISTNIVQALTGQFAIRSTGQTLPLVTGVEGGGGIDRTGVTTNITTAVSIQGDQIVNLSPGTATITDTFGVRGFQSTGVGTRNNFAIGSEGDMMISNNNGLFVENGSSPALKVLGFKTTGTTFSIGIANDGSGFKHLRGTTGCTTGASVGAACTTVVTWTTAFADANYTAACSGGLVTAGIPVSGGITAKIAASVTFQTVAATASAAKFTTIDCWGYHD